MKLMKWEDARKSALEYFGFEADPFSPVQISEHMGLTYATFNRDRWGYQVVFNGLGQNVKSSDWETN